MLRHAVLWVWLMGSRPAEGRKSELNYAANGGPGWNWPPDGSWFSCGLHILSPRQRVERSRQILGRCKALVRVSWPGNKSQFDQNSRGAGAGFRMQEGGAGGRRGNDLPGQTATTELPVEPGWTPRSHLIEDNSQGEKGPERGVSWGLVQNLFPAKRKSGECP